MGTALAATQQQSIEATARSWARIHNADRCPRCGGMMVAEWCEDLSDYTAQRCVQCGEVIDPVILQNRRQFGIRIGPGQKREYISRENGSGNRKMQVKVSPGTLL
jgi:rRNA maturation protein Nop10